MKSSTKDKAKGMFHQVKGKIKETAGDLTDDQKLEVEGAAEKMGGKYQENVGKVKKAWGH
ncbi:MAG: CsbD family protein [Smithellaceae bacterium]